MTESINKLLLNEPPLIVLPSLAEAIGLNEAIFLQQLHYWLTRSPHFFDGRKWVYNTHDGWNSQFRFWSRATMRRIIETCEDRTYIVTTTKYNRNRGDKTKWYSILSENLDKIKVPSFQTVSAFPSLTGSGQLELLSIPPADGAIDKILKSFLCDEWGITTELAPGERKSHRGMITEYGLDEWKTSVVISKEAGAKTLRFLRGVLKKRKQDLRSESGSSATQTMQCGASVKLNDVQAHRNTCPRCKPADVKKVKEMLG